jgi:hypothetical protein
MGSAYNRIVTNPHSTELARAIERLLENDWRAAHAIVQDLDDPIAWRIHGLVHRLEGDLANSRYWYSKAGLTLDRTRSVEDEINDLRDTLGQAR